MIKYLKIGCLTIVGLAGLSFAALLLLALFAKPMPSTAEALATVPESERAALQQLTSLANMETNALRHINSYDGAIFDDDRNQSSIVIKSGHIVGLCMRKASFSSLPVPDGLTALEALDWRECSLTQWPDLSKLTALKQLKLSGQPLPDAPTDRLPRNIQLLHLADTKITDTAPFATLSYLAELVLSGTAITNFEPLVHLRLDVLNLANTRLVTLPAIVPTTGEWQVDLDGTPLLNPSNYSSQWPLDNWVSGTSEKQDTSNGVLSASRVEVAGTVAAISKSRAIPLPRCTDSGVPTVNVTVTCTAGEAMVWLEEPPDFFPSPWMKQHKVKGFGIFRKGGYVSQTLSPDSPCSLRGKLRLTTQSRIYDMPANQRNAANAPPDWCDYSFYVQPLNGSTVTGLQYRIN